MNFNLAGHALPPTPVQIVLTEQPELCWGILLFDILMMNTDRHRQNLSYDRVTKKVQIFDHSRAFLPLKTDIDAVITANTGKLGLAAHCLQTEISSMDGFVLWCKRIKALPDYAIGETLIAICEVGFPSAKTKTASDFLKSRRDGIDGLVTSNIAQFPKIPPPPSVVPTPGPAAAHPPAGANP